MIKLREIVMIHELNNQGLGISEIVRRSGLDHKIVRKHLRCGLQSARYGPRQPRPRLLDLFERYLRERIAVWPGMSERRLWREIAELGYAGGYTAVTNFLCEARLPVRTAFERRFETPPGKQAQVDFSQILRGSVLLSGNTARLPRTYSHLSRSTSNLRALVNSRKRSTAIAAG